MKKREKEKVMFLDEATLHRYISNKIYYAKPMTRTQYNNERGWASPEKDDEPGYVILYPDGYISWSPARQFEETSSRTDHMNFGMALVALKKGLKVARRGWNATDQWLRIAFLRGTEGVPTQFIPFKGYAPPNLRNFVVLKTVDDQFVPWLASQSDMLMDDWFIVD